MLQIGMSFVAYFKYGEPIVMNTIIDRSALSVGLFVLIFVSIAISGFLLYKSIDFYDTHIKK